MNSKMSKEPKKEGLREKIVKVALDELAVKGHEALSVREIAALCGVATSAPNRHFTVKAELLTELAIQGFQQLGQAVSIENQIADQQPVAKLKALCEAYLQFASNQQNLYRLMFSHGLFTADGSVKIEALKPAILWPIKAASADVFPSDPSNPSAAAELVGILWAFLHGLSLLMLDNLADDEQRIASSIQFLDHSIDTIVAGIQSKAQPE